MELDLEIEKEMAGCRARGADIDIQPLMASLSPKPHFTDAAPEIREAGQAVS